MRTQLTVIAAAVAFTISGCANMTETQKGTAKGAGIGAVAGAVVGAVAGGSKGAAIGAAVGGVAGGVGGNIWSKRMQEQKRQMEEATAGTGVQVSQTADNQLKLDIPSDISFDSGRADIKSNFRPILDNFANGLNSNPAATVTVIGHTDSSGNDAINNPLSVNRAASVRDYLSSRGVATSRVSIDGRGSREPVAANDTPANRAMNRRVEIYVAEPQPAAQ
ncbi:OmpA family protein [Methylobacillus flagellatus]|uniref:OmpA family protein n=1 Tax=Methylobacillus flagellatus TaxID=405 RepID=UPI0010F699F2|nr:OmpA family protein [Methylobacillus flagellatus]